MIFKKSLKGVLLLSKATFVSARFTSAFAQIGKTLQGLCVGIVLSDTSEWKKQECSLQVPSEDWPLTFHWMWLMWLSDSARQDGCHH